VPSVRGLFVYPVKGCRGISLERAQVEERGFAHDRRWMFVNEVDLFVTQRTAPGLARVDVSIDEVAGTLRLSTDGHDPLELPLEPRDGQRRTVRVWGDDVEVLDGGPGAARWATEVLGSTTTLVFMPDRTRRSVSPTYGRAGDVVSFADAFPLLLTTTASLDDLNSRLARPLPMDRFRPNVVVDGVPPWSEDTWRHLTVGRLGVRIVKGCDRCVVTTTDQRTGERGVEPLRALAKFREREHKVYFGMNGIPDGTGSIALGDPVTTTG
jgi:hypothetical protein